MTDTRKMLSEESVTMASYICAKLGAEFHSTIHTALMKQHHDMMLFTITPKQPDHYNRIEVTVDLADLAGNKDRTAVYERFCDAVGDRLFKMLNNTLTGEGRKGRPCKPSITKASMHVSLLKPSASDPSSFTWN